MVERQEYEPTPERMTADFEGYRKVVETLSTAFRKVGIVDEAGYDRAMRDPRTMRLAIGQVEMPFLAPIEYVAGYDVERSSRLTEQEDVFVMSVPVSVLTGPDVRVLSEESAFKPGESAIIVETDHNETGETQDMLPEVLSSIGDFKVGEFLDSRIRNPNQQAAMMAMYEARFEAVDENGEFIQPTDIDFYAAYDQLLAQDHPLTKTTTLLHVDELRHNDELVDQLWDLCSDRFDWLGAAHPVSMEDTKDFFEQMVRNDDTHTIVRYNDEAESGCLGVFMTSLEGCPWLKPLFADQITEELEAKGERMIYFFGLAGGSNGDSAHYGKDVMQLLANIVHVQGGACRLLFESTNMSSRYIPRMVGSYIGEGAGLRMPEPVAQTARLDYWYAAPKTD